VHSHCCSSYVSCPSPRQLACAQARIQVVSLMAIATRDPRAAILGKGWPVAAARVHSSSSDLLKNSAMGSKYCYSYYGNSKTWCYTKKGDGSFAKSGCSSYNGYGPEWCCPDKIRCRADSPAPAPPATSSLTLRDSGTGNTGKCYSYYGSKKKTEWCYTKKKGGSFASSKCGSYDGHKTDWCCPEKVNCHTSGSSSGSCQASALGQYIADFVKGKKGQKVHSAMQGSASCWDLAWGAMEHAEKKGHNPIFWQKASHWADNNAWSSD